MPYRKTLAVTLLALLLLALTGCGEKNEGPATFQVGEESLPALPLTDGGELVDAAVPEEGAEGAAVYTYEDIPAAASLAREYAAMLAEESFTPLDEADYSQEEGSVALVRDAAQEGRQLQINLTWSQGTCVVTVDTLTIEEEAPEPMTLRDAVEYLQGFAPAQLGLDGSMNDYIIYPKLGTVFVDGVACLELDLYRCNELDTHDIVASYFLSGDRANLYRLDHTTGLVDEL